MIFDELILFLSLFIKVSHLTHITSSTQTEKNLTDGANQLEASGSARAIEFLPNFCLLNFETAKIFL